MNFFASVNNAWLIALYPLVSAVLIMLFTNRSRVISMSLSIMAVAIGLIHSLVLFLVFMRLKPTKRI